MNKVWTLPVCWELVGKVKIEAETIEEAVDKFREHRDSLLLPYGEYSDDSFDLVSDDLEFLESYDRDHCDE